MIGCARRANPVIDLRVRGLCRRPYAGHPEGCPNWNRRPTCPPEAPLLGRVLVLNRPVYCIHNRFNLASHVARMRAKHPNWSERKLRCCLYWQGTARAALRRRVSEFLEAHPRLLPLYCPEACGVDVTATMAAIGITLEWPPVHVAYQVALVGSPRS